ncbi:unnamed protein product [Lupinus luteus]|uniref:STICHEL DnaA-N-like alpha-beta domain-containing protein n=1 Tax=Lupinus luteus TaxID=3873 RepID=A0AAV1XY16_LUPLU
MEEIWFELLDMIQMTGLKEFLYTDGKQISVSFVAEIRCETNKDVSAVHQSPILSGINNRSPQIRDSKDVTIQGHPSVTGSVEKGRGEIVEEAASPVQYKNNTQQGSAHAGSS